MTTNITPPEEVKQSELPPRNRFAKYERLLIGSLLAIWFVLIFVLFVRFTFPISNFKESIATQIDSALSQVKMSKNCDQMGASLSLLSLNWFNGLSFKPLELFCKNSVGNKSVVWHLDSLDVNVSLLKLMRGNTKLKFNAEMGKGDLSVVVQKNNKTGEQLFTLDARALQLQRLLPESLTGLPLSGTLEAFVEGGLKREGLSTFEGPIDVSLKKIILGPGEIQLTPGSSMSAFSIPKVNIDTLSIRAQIQDGQSPDLKIVLKGPDLEAEMSGNFRFAYRLEWSQIRGDGFIKLSPAFLKKNPNFKTLLSLLPGAKEATDSEGRMRFTLSGTVSSPQFQLKT